MLLERGARIDDRNENGQTPLHLAVLKGNIQVVRLVLEHSADVNARNKLGETPSQLTRQQEILELLSKYGAKSRVV
jgi:ankyrin repeat protein